MELDKEFFYHLFKTFFERILLDALKEPDEKVSAGDRNITILRFADDMGIAEEKQELDALVESLDKTCTRYKMETGDEKTKLMTNSASSIHESKKTDTGHRNKLKKPWSSCLRWWFKTGGSLNDCTSHCSSYKAEVNSER